MYMNLLGKPTHPDLDKFPHVLLTGPHEWDPSILDYTHPATTGDPIWAPDPTQSNEHDPRIDEFAILMGEFTTLSLIPPDDPTWLITNMISKLNH